jgi:hypothetical protein
MLLRGDSVSDVQMAKELGSRSFSRHRRQFERAVEAGSDWIVKILES